MPAAFRCPHCKQKFQIDKSEEDRTFKCRMCGGMVEFRGRPDSDDDLPKLEPTKKRFNLQELPGWATALMAAAVLGVLVYLVMLGTGQVGEPHDRLYAALADRYDALTDLVNGLDTPEAAQAAAPEMREHVAEVNRLLADPRPFGRGKKSVGAAFLREYEGAMKSRLEALRDAKGRAFKIQGVGSVVSNALRDLPNSSFDLERKLDG